MTIYMYCSLGHTSHWHLTCTCTVTQTVPAHTPNPCHTASSGARIHIQMTDDLHDLHMTSKQRHNNDDDGQLSAAMASDASPRQPCGMADAVMCEMRERYPKTARAHNVVSHIGAESAEL